MLSAAVLLDLLEHKRFSVEYQPLVSTQSGEIIGHEALARFHAVDGTGLPPDLVFESLHQSPLTLFQVELAMKTLQIELAPEQGLLLLNLDPHAAAAWENLSADNPLVKKLSSRNNTIVELIENTSVSDALLCIELAKVLKSQGAELALDDVGAPDTMLSLPLLTSVDMIKFDRSWAQQLEDSNYRHMLYSLIEYARRMGKRTVLEGIETQEQQQQASQLGIDYLQGYLYRPQFIVRKSATDRVPVAA